MPWANLETANFAPIVLDRLIATKRVSQLELHKWRGGLDIPFSDPTDDDSDSRLQVFIN
jgi:hypothetical protein